MTAVARPAAVAPRNDLLSWITTTDHKRIGILYLVTSLGYFAVAGALAIVIRTQLARPNNDVVSAHTYAQLFTLHGTAMIFLFVAPFALGLANFLIPLQIGAPDMAFPRLNATSYWMFLLGGLVIFSGVATNEGGAATGLDRIRAALGDCDQHGARARPVDRRRLPRVGRDDSHLDQLRYDGLHLSCTGHDDVAHPDLHVGNGRDVAVDLHGVPDARRGPAVALRRPAPRRPCLRPGTRRQSGALSAPVLVFSGIRKCT